MLSTQCKLLATAVIAALSLSACGTKKDLYGDPTPPPAPAPQQGAPQANGTPNGGLYPIGKSDPNNPSTISGGQSTPGGTPETNSGGLSNTGELPPPPKLEPAPINNDDNSDDDNGSTITGGEGGTPRRAAPPTVVDTRPLPAAPQSSSTLPDYNSRDPKNIDRDGMTKRITGGATAEGLLYTSSSTDNIMDFLRARNEKMSYGTRAMNKAAAASVVGATLSIDRDSSEAIVTLKVVENQETRIYNLAGAVGGGSANQLKVVRSGLTEKTTGSRPLMGTIKCLDFDGGCENTFVRLQIGAKGESAIINVVFRQSASDLYFSLSAPSGNQEYGIMRDFAYNTIQGNPSPNRANLTQVTMSSWEVVNGRSGFVTSILGLNRELLAFSGPLLAPEAGSSVNVSLDRVTGLRNSSSDLIGGNSVSLNYQNMIADARLVANNGLGQIRILFKMRSRGGYSNDQFAITYLRKIKPIVSLTDENLK